MLEIKNLDKSFGKLNVLNNLSAEFEDNKVYGLIGANGSGKTTLMKIISNHIPNYKGEVLFDGMNVTENQQAISDIVYVGDGFPKSATTLSQKIDGIFKTVKLFRPDFDMDYALELLDKFKLSKKSKYKKLSTGNKTIVELIIGLASRAKLTIFDEPSSGLDAVNRYKFYSYLMEDLEKYPRTVIISTHIIGEIENYLTDVKILNDGKFILEDEVLNIQSRAYKVKDYEPASKNIVAREFIAGSKFYYVYDTLSEDEIKDIELNMGTVSKVDLQRIFVAMIGGQNE